MPCIEVLHVVAALQVLMHDPFAGRSEGLDGVQLSLLHLGLVAALDNGHTLSRMNLIRADRVSVEIPDRLDRVSLPVNLDFIRLHDLLNRGTNVAQAHVDACLPYSRVGGLLDGLGKVVVTRILVPRERTIDDPPVDVRSKIELHDVVLLQNGRVPRVRSPVRGHVVDAAAGWEGDSSVRVVVLDQFADLVLQLLAQVDHLLSRLGDGLEVFPRRPVDLRCLPKLLVLCRVQLLEFLLLGGSASVRVLALVLVDLPLREVALGEEVLDGHGGLGPRLLLGRDRLLLALLAAPLAAFSSRFRRRSRAALNEAGVLHDLLDPLLGDLPFLLLLHHGPDSLDAIVRVLGLGRLDGLCQLLRGGLVGAALVGHP
mmetsp:Transcript_8318/g.20659  ORF Transcript_8318/g.20659 Transcript_8318/m.20659 type:complete len:370 (+) Transcript_8318:1018-2127(+)